MLSLSDCWVQCLRSVAAADGRPEGSKGDRALHSSGGSGKGHAHACGAPRSRPQGGVEIFQNFIQYSLAIGHAANALY